MSALFWINGLPQGHGDVAEFGVPFLAMPVKSRFLRSRFWRFAKNSAKNIKFGILPKIKHRFWRINL